jgi:hypothetical protein
MEEPPEWPAYNIGSREHMHAIGILIAAWNSVEDAYQCFTQLVFPNHMKAGIQVFELMRNDERVKLIRSELPSIILKVEYDLVDYFLKCANICKQNRNSIAPTRHYFAGARMTSL